MASQTKLAMREKKRFVFIFVILSALRQLNRTGLRYFPRSLLKKVLNFFFGEARRTLAFSTLLVVKYLRPSCF